MAIAHDDDLQLIEDMVGPSQNPFSYSNSTGDARA